jgi:putative FmdB family regulatory protein
MPLYEYECDACRQRFEIIQKFSDPPAEKCDACGKGPVRRLLSSPAIQFKGSGWYITDYAQKGKTEKTGASASTSDTSGKSDNKAESKTEKKTDAKTDSGSSSTASTPAKT